MSKNRRIPAYQLHKATGQAKVRIAGKDHYLGKYGSPASHDKYDELIAELVIEKQSLPAKTLTAVLAVWWPECKKRYRKGKGRLGGAVSWRPVIRLLRENHGAEPADRLGPATLRRLIEAEAERKDWSLRYAKDVLAKVKLLYRWAAAEELVDVAAYNRLAVCEIREGRRTRPIPPVADELVNKTLPHLSLKIADMVRPQRFTGMRPGELVIMRLADVDRSGDVWTYIPEHHKTEHHGKSRTIYIGPKAQVILAPWLVKADQYVFPSRGRRCYTSDSYRQVIHRACQRNEIKT